jgi:HEPN domain-containing protein
METDFLKKRAESFLRDAKFAISEKRWFAAAFHLEQTCQLYLKYFLFSKLRDFPKTHSLTELLKALGRAYKREKEVKKFLENNEEEISDLEEAYLTSRYLPVEFSQKQVIKMRNFTLKLIKFLKGL